MGCPRGCLKQFTKYSVEQIIFLMVAIVPSDPDNTLHPSAALLLTRDCFSPSGAGCTTSFFEPMHPNVMQHPFSKTNDHLTPRGCLHMVRVCKVARCVFDMLVLCDHNIVFCLRSRLCARVCTACNNEAGQHLDAWCGQHSWHQPVNSQNI